MQVVADFDYTLSASVTEAGERCDLTYDVLAKAAVKKKPHYVQLFRDLNEKYSPVEADLSLSVEDKSPAMEDWFVYVKLIGHRYAIYY